MLGRTIKHMPHISQALIDLYSAGPSPSKTSQVANLQTAIRGALGEDGFDTFLQGSYRNSTAIADINDVDIVARLKGEVAPLSAAEWGDLFGKIAERVRSSYRITGTVSLGDKCVKLQGPTLNADIVPAVAKHNLVTDPIAIWSRGLREERPNYPRTHYSNGVAKQGATSSSFKSSVRLLKRWARQFSDFSTIAPSFYLECAVYQVENDKFRQYLPMSFAQVGAEICSWSKYRVVHTVAGDKDILVPGEWSSENFETFQTRLRTDVSLVTSAMEADTPEEANRLWKIAFGTK